MLNKGNVKKEAAMNCGRCGGLMVAEHFYGGYSSDSCWSYNGFRCLNCGDIADPVVLPHHAVPSAKPVKGGRRWPRSLLPKDIAENDSLDYGANGPLMGG